MNDGLFQHNSTLIPRGPYFSNSGCVIWKKTTTTKNKF